MHADAGDSTAVDTSNITDDEVLHFLERAREEFTERLSLVDIDQHYNIVVQRFRFWDRLLRQRFDVTTRHVRVIFAGEAAADGGGPMREFLTLFCRQFPDLPGLVFGDNNNVFFKMLPVSVQGKQYFMLGQLCALAIIKIGRGPECLNPSVVKCLFSICYDNDDINHNNGELHWRGSTREIGVY